MRGGLSRRFHIKDLAEAFQPFYSTVQKLRVSHSAPDPQMEEPSSSIQPPG